MAVLSRVFVSKGCVAAALVTAIAILSALSLAPASLQ
jgi:hypothetical protein